MSNLKEKLQVFMVGLMVGLIIAGVFFIFKLDNYFKELNFYKSISKTFSSNQKKEEYVLNTDETEKLNDKKVIGNTIKSKSNFNSESSNTKMPKPALVLDADTLNLYSSKDSLSFNKVVSEDFVVRKDELISTKTFEVLNLYPLTNRNISKDSILQLVSGVKDDRNNNKQFFNIEFWQSPLNYKGYKMSKFKIVLYGIVLNDGIKVYKLDDVVYLKNMSLVLKLDYTSDFKSFDRITDDVIINKLK
jgi:hypothetical protein